MFIKKIISNSFFDITFKDASQNMFFRIIGIFFGLGFTLFVSKFYGIKYYGMFTIAYTIITMATILSKLGLDILLLKYNSTLRDKNSLKMLYQKVLIVCISLASVYASLIFIFSNNLASIFSNSPELLFFIKISSLGIIPNVVIAINFESFRGLNKLNLYSYFSSFKGFFITLIFISICILTDFTEFKYIMVSFIISLYINAFISTFLLYKQFETEKSLNTIVERNDNVFYPSLKLSNLISESYPFMTSNAIVFFNNWFDVFLVGIILNEHAVGIYSIIIKLSSFLSLFLISINSIAAPKIAKYFKNKNYSNLNELVNNISHKTLILLFPNFILIFLFSFIILGYLEILNQFILLTLAVLFFKQIINVGSGPSGILFQMTGQQKINQNLLLLYMITCISLNILLIPVLNIFGAALSGFVGMSIISILSIFITKNKYGFYPLYFLNNKKLLNNKNKYGK